MFVMARIVARENFTYIVFILAQFKIARANCGYSDKVQGG
jgi:hypothetical protein